MTVQIRAHWRLQVLLALVFVSVAMRAQQQDLSVPVGTEMPAVAFQSEGKVKNVLRADLTASGYFDDNAFGLETDRVSDLGLRLNPVFGFQQTRSRWQVDLTYAPGLILSQRLPYQSTQMGGADIHYMPTPRLSFHVRQDYAVTTDPFQSLIQNGFLPQPSPTNRPNTPAIFPRYKQTVFSSNAGVGYRLSRRTSVGLNGYYSDVRYDILANGLANGRSALVRTKTATGTAYWSHQLSARQTIGFQYTLLDLSFPQGGSLGFLPGFTRTRAHNFQFFDNITLSRRSTLSVYAGPEYYQTHGQEFVNFFFFLIEVPFHRTSWSQSAGAVYNWKGTKNAIQAGYSRAITDGGGLIGAVKNNSGFVRIRRQLPAQLTGDLGGQVSDNSGLDLPSNQYHYRVVSGSAGLTRKINSRTSLRLSYSRLNQTTTIVPVGNHDRAELSLSYDLRKPLGR
jgi:hypothetical protein